MFFICRNFGRKVLTVVEKLNSPSNSVTRYHFSSKTVKTEFFHKKCFCTSSADDSVGHINYNLITNGDKELEHKVKVLELELEVMRQEGLLVPETAYISTEQWKNILELRSRGARTRFYEFLFKTQKKKENEKAKKLEKAKKRLEELSKEEKPGNLPVEEFAQTYGLKYNSVFLRIYDTTINQLYNNKLIQAIMFGEKLVIDCGYELDMTKREISNCAKQIMLLFADNRLHDDPFDIHLCNVNKAGNLMGQLHKFIPTMYEPWFPLNIHEKSYLDVFSRDQLVYLTPHCREEMEEFDHDAVYILGGIVDKTNNEPLSLAKAKKERLKMAKLPLDKYLHWGSGAGKSLTLNQMTSILLDVKISGNWDHALQHVPRRKIVQNDPRENITTTNRLQYGGRSQKISNWVPSGFDFEKLRYGKNSFRNEQTRTKKDRINNVRNIINEYK